MNNRNWRRIYIGAVCIAAILAGMHGRAAASEAGPDEAAVIEVLKGDAGLLEKQAACRSLRQTGAVASIPALAALLPDPELSHMARYALEAMPYPEAGQALRDALAKTEGMPKAGVIISIGARRDRDAVPLLVPLLKDPDVNVARAAAGALGRIATPRATHALLDFRGDAPDAERTALAEGLLATGQCLAQDGKSRQAASVYRKLLAPSWPMYVRMGAFYGLAHARPKQAPKRLIEGLGDDEPLFRDVAGQIIAETSGEDTTKRYGRALSKLPSGGQVALLRGLAGRGDPSAHPAVAQAALSPDRDVKLAALKAIGALGSAQDMDTLTRFFPSDDTEIGDAAKSALNDICSRGDTAAAPALLGALCPHLGEPAVQNEVAKAIIAVAVELGTQGETGRRQAIAALKAVGEKCPDTTIQERAQQALAGFQ